MSQTETLEPGVYRGNVELIVMLWDGVKASAVGFAPELKAAIAECGGSLESIHAHYSSQRGAGLGMTVRYPTSDGLGGLYQTYSILPGEAFVATVASGMIVHMTVISDHIARNILSSGSPDVVVIGEVMQPFVAIEGG